METVLFIPLVKAPEDCIELKFALRSMQSCFHIDKLVICGQYVPDWLTNFELLHYANGTDPRFKEQRIYEKTLLALQKYDRIIFANDDHFVSDFFIPFFNYSEGYLSDKIENVNRNGYYYKTLINTREYLGLEAVHYFDVHCPIIYERDKFPPLVFNDHWGLCLKTMYGVYNDLQSSEVKDCKIRVKQMRYSNLDNQIFFSTHEAALCPQLIDYLQNRWPNKSKFEK